MKKMIIVGAIFLGGCATLFTTSTGVVPIGQDTYMISRTEKGFIGSSSRVKAEAFKEANQFCVSQGKKLQVVSTSQKDMVLYQSDAQAEIQFMCLDTNDAELTRPKLKKEADTVIEIRK
jgi:hypothetical protein